MSDNRVIEGRPGTNGKVDASTLQLRYHRRVKRRREFQGDLLTVTPDDAGVAAPLSIGDLHEQVEDALADINLAVAAGADRLAEAARYALLAGGKRVRPLLVMATAQAMGSPTDGVLPTACAIEMIHTNSLIVRRPPRDGQPPETAGTTGPAPRLRR